MYRSHALTVLLIALVAASGACGGSNTIESSPDAGDETGFSCDRVDTETDPQNCGACGRTCIIPNAEAGCSAGKCTIDLCDEGFLDSDGELANGCELAGAVSGEACNLVDDDQDGACDEGAIEGCRGPVHRSNGNGHLYTSDIGSASSAPFSVEAENYFYLYSANGPGLAQAYLCQKSNDRYFLTSSANCEGAGTVVQSPGFWATAESCGATPLYRTYSSAGGNHFFTTSAPERNNAVANLGYQDEGIAGYVWLAP